MANHLEYERVVRRAVQAAMTAVQELRERKRHILREMAAADLLRREHAFARWKRELEEVREALADAHRAGALEMANHEIRRLRAAAVRRPTGLNMEFSLGREPPPPVRW